MLVRLKDAPYYKPLIWFIQKYGNTHLPDPNTEVVNDAGFINLMCTWRTTIDGHDYWRRLSDLSNGIFYRDFGLSAFKTAFQLMTEAYQKDNPQLELDF
jgi:hypothetical protein